MPKERDYKKEVQQRKARQAAKVTGVTAPRVQTKKDAQKAAKDRVNTPKISPKGQPKEEQPVPVPPDCGHISVALSQIVSDPNQPRKFFDALKMVELSKSIILHDVIEPILIRPIGGGLYMIVFGERRFRGSLMAAEAGYNITHIPAMIRELTEAEARELQLVENLHRTDPHPIEDAYTFKAMLEDHSIGEIALRIGKSEKFVAMRIILTDLIQDFQDVFFANKMSLGQAVLLCKVGADAQKAIFANEVRQDWKEDQDFMLDDIQHLVKKESKNLDSAPFKTEDPDLYPEMGACGKCQFNSANTLQLFVEQQTSRICGNAICFNIKCARAYKQNIEQIMTDPEVVFVAGGHYNEQDKQKVKDVEKLGVPVLAPGSWRKVGVMEKPILEQWIADNEDTYDTDYESREEFEARIKVEWEEGIKEYNEEVAEVEAGRKDGKIRKAFIVVGNEEGKVVEIMTTTPQAELKLGGTTDGVDNNIVLQIDEIKKREERKKELDAEKIWTEIRSQMLVGDHFTKDGIITFTENLAVATAIYDALEYNAKKAFTTTVLKVEDYNDEMKISSALQNLSSAQQSILYRTFIGCKLFPVTGSHLKNYVNAAAYSLAKNSMPSTVTNIESEINIKAEKRAQKVKKAIEDLQEPAVK